MPKAPSTAAAAPSPQVPRPAHPRDGLLRLQRRYGSRRAAGIIREMRNSGPVDGLRARDSDGVPRPATASPAGRAPGERTERVSGAETDAQRLRADVGAGRRAAAFGVGAATAGADVFLRRSGSRPDLVPGDARAGHEVLPTVRPGVAEVPAVAPVCATTEPAVQRISAVEEARRHDPHGGHAAEEQRSLVHEVLRTPGRPLDAPLRTEMETRFGGADFSGVRVHSDAVAQRSAQEIQAKAYTSGPHVVDGGGMSKEDWAHELTHYLDQQAGPVPGTDNGAGLSVSDPSDRGERRAVENARRVMSTAAPARPVSAELDRGGPVPVRRDGQPAVQRVLDGNVITAAQATLGITTVKIVEVPKKIGVDTPFSQYGNGRTYGLTQADLLFSVSDLYPVWRGDIDATAYDVVWIAGGGVYHDATGIILVNDPPNPGHTVTETIRHEMGHRFQSESGFSVDKTGGRGALVEYHNILVNENRLTGGMRIVYNDADRMLKGEAQAKARRQEIDLGNLWQALVDYVQDHDDTAGTQQALLDAIIQELQDNKYNPPETAGGPPMREVIQNGLATKYFNDLLAPQG